MENQAEKENSVVEEKVKQHLAEKEYAAFQEKLKQEQAEKEYAAFQEMVKQKQAEKEHASAEEKVKRIQAEKEYAAFQEKVKRTVFFDNLSPQVTEAVFKTALAQYGTVSSVRFLPYYTEPPSTSKRALVEFEKDTQASSVVGTATTYPFMICAMPRPVRARLAVPEMFDDRPPKPGRKVQVYWLDEKDPDFEVTEKLKDLVKKHAAERSSLYEMQLEEEEKLAKQQNETLRAHHQKFDGINSLMGDGSMKRLAKRYGMSLPGGDRYD